MAGSQFGNFVIAVQLGVAPRVYDLPRRARCGARRLAPQASYVSVVGRFVVLTGLVNNPYRIHWSGLNAVTTWTSGTGPATTRISRTAASCAASPAASSRDLPGRRHAAHDLRARRALHLQIERIAEDKAAGAYSLIAPATAPSSWPRRASRHGRDRGAGADRQGALRPHLLADYDAGNPQLLIGAADPQKSRVTGPTSRFSGTAGLFDTLLVYDYVLNRASVVSLAGEYLASLARPGLTLENLDSISGSLDALPFSLDDVSTAALSKLSAIDGGHKLGFPTGDNLEAVIDTAEQAINGRRVRVKGLRPITDAAACFGCVSARETVQADAVFN